MNRSDEEEAAIRQARRALGETLAALVPVDEAIRLAAVAYAAGFTDLLRASVATGNALTLMEAVNRELRSAGLEVVAKQRH